MFNVLPNKKKKYEFLSDPKLLKVSVLECVKNVFEEDFIIHLHLIQEVKL